MTGNTSRFKLNSSIKIKITAVIATAVIFAIITLLLRVMLGKEGLLLPLNATWCEKEDVLENHSISLADKKLRVTYRDGSIYESDEDVFVQDYLICDLEGDGVKDLVTLCYKRGRYGEAKPFWVEEDTIKYCQHIYVYELYDELRSYRGKSLFIKPKWMASDIGLMARQMEYRDGCLKIRDDEGIESTWVWTGFGFGRVN